MYKKVQLDYTKEYTWLLKAKVLSSDKSASCRMNYDNSDTTITILQLAGTSKYICRI